MGAPGRMTAYDLARINDGHRIGADHNRLQHTRGGEHMARMHEALYKADQLFLLSIEQDPSDQPLVPAPR